MIKVSKEFSSPDWKIEQPNYTVSEYGRKRLNLYDMTWSMYIWKKFQNLIKEKSKREYSNKWASKHGDILGVHFLKRMMAQQSVQIHWKESANQRDVNGERERERRTQGRLAQLNFSACSLSWCVCVVELTALTNGFCETRHDQSRNSNNIMVRKSKWSAWLSRASQNVRN